MLQRAFQTDAQRTVNRAADRAGLSPVEARMTRSSPRASRSPPTRACGQAWGACTRAWSPT